MSLYKLNDDAKKGLTPDNFYWDKLMTLAKWKKIGYGIKDLIKI